jgi:ribose 5-phosphate isomerase B
MRIALATDHAGYEQLKDIQSFLRELGHDCVNLGPTALNPDDDYPEFIFKAAAAVARGDCERAVIMGGSGQGEAMAANRFKSVRCAVFYGPSVARKVVDIEGRVSHDPYEIIKLSREHNDSNVLSLAARFVTMKDMKQAVRLWLETPFGGSERHSRRIGELDREGS